ncbi:uncharacterized protein ACWYII_034030 [Salvelinus alpinus]
MAVLYLWSRALPGYSSMYHGSAVFVEQGAAWPPRFPRLDDKPPRFPRLGDKPPRFPRLGDKPPRFPRLDDKPPRFPRLDDKPPRFPRLDDKPPRFPRLDDKPPRFPRLDDKPPRFPRLDDKPPRFPRLECRLSAGRVVGANKGDFDWLDPYNISRRLVSDFAVAGAVEAVGMVISAVRLASAAGPLDLATDLPVRRVTNSMFSATRKRFVEGVESDYPDDTMYYGQSSMFPHPSDKDMLASPSPSSSGQLSQLGASLYGSQSALGFPMRAMSNTAQLNRILPPGNQLPSHVTPATGVAPTMSLHTPPSPSRGILPMNTRSMMSTPQQVGRQEVMVGGMPSGGRTNSLGSSGLGSPNRASPSIICMPKQQQSRQPFTINR